MTFALPDLWQHLQRQLFPMLAEELGPLSELDEQFWFLAIFSGWE